MARSGLVLIKRSCDEFDLRGFCIEVSEFPEMSNTDKNYLVFVVGDIKLESLLNKVYNVAARFIIYRGLAL